MRHSTAVVMLTVLAACGAGTEELKEISQGQREIRAKLTDLEKKIDQIAKAAPARPSRPQIDPDKVHNIPPGNSPFKGPADASVVLVEFSDFQ